MPAIQTGGFNMQVMPRVDFQPASALAPAYGEIIPNISSGVDFSSKLMGIADTARMRPIKQRLAEISLARGENDLANFPLENQIRGETLGQMQIQNTAGEVVIESVTPQDESEEKEDFYPSPDADPNNPTDTPEGEFKKRFQYGDLYKITKGYRILPNGQKIPFERKELVESAQSRQDKAKYAEALASQRESYGAAAVTRAETAQDRVDQNGVRWKKIDRGMKDGVLVEIFQSPTGEVRVEPVQGVTPIETPMNAYFRSAMGENTAQQPSLPNNIAAAPAGAQMFTIPGIAPVAPAAPAAPPGMQNISSLPENISEVPTYEPANIKVIPVGIEFQYKGKRYMKQPDGRIYSIAPKKG